MKFKNLIKNVWFISISGSLVAAVIFSSLAAFLKKISFSDASIYIASTIYKCVLQVLVYKMPLWVMLASFCILLLIFLIISKIIDAQPEWINYKKEFYKSWLFCWEYSKEDGVNKVTKIHPICVKCGCLLSQKLHEYCDDDNCHQVERYLFCPNCQSTYTGPGSSILDEINKLIIHKINSGEYKKSQYYESEVKAKNK